MSSPEAVASDARPEAQAWLVARWRSMSTVEKAELVNAMCSDVDTLALAGIRSGPPDLAPEDVPYLLAVRRYGSALADEAYHRQRGE